jgi:hypothetical protein
MKPKNRRVAHLSRIPSRMVFAGVAHVCVSPPIPPVQHNRVLRSTTGAAHPVCFTAMLFKIGRCAATTPPRRPPPLSFFQRRAADHCKALAAADH